MSSPRISQTSAASPVVGKHHATTPWARPTSCFVALSMVGQAFQLMNNKKENCVRQLHWGGLPASIGKAILICHFTARNDFQFLYLALVDFIGVNNFLPQMGSTTQFLNCENSQSNSM